MSFFAFLFKLGCSLGDRSRDKKYVFPEEITRHEGIQYGEDATWNTLDVYSPPGEALPVIVSVHGGGYIYGSRHTYRAYGHELARRGFVVVNFSYSLAPQKKYPCQLDEINSVFKWIHDNITTYGGDSRKLFVVGDSAGAQLASQYMTILTNSDYARNFSFSPPDVTVKGAALNCGMYDISQGENSVWSRQKSGVGKLLTAVRDDYLTPEQRADPLLAVPEYMTADFPPAYIMTSEFDFLREESRPLADRLEALGVKTRYRLYGSGDDKRFAHVFHLNWAFDAAQACNDDECAFFKELMSEIKI